MYDYKKVNFVRLVIWLIPVYAIGFVVRAKKAKKMGDLVPKPSGWHGGIVPTSRDASTKIIQVAHICPDNNHRDRP